MARQMQENFRVKGKKLYFGFVDLEKAFDRVPREVISWAIRKLGVEEWLVSAVMFMYTGAKTVVRTVYGNSKGFEVKVKKAQLITLWFGRRTKPRFVMSRLLLVKSVYQNTNC